MRRAAEERHEARVRNARCVRAVGAAVAAGLAVLGLAGVCIARAHSAEASGGVLQVVAAENVWGSIAAQLGGSRVHVTSVVSSPAVDPRRYRPTAADGRAFAGADLLIVNQVGYDSWADRLAAEAPRAGRIELGVGALVGVSPGDNPRRWYDPCDVDAVIAAITADYQRLDPAHSGYFGRLQESYENTGLAGYHTLIRQIRDQYAGTPVGASESVAEPLAQALDLDLVTPGSFLNEVTAGETPPAAQQSLIDQEISAHRIRVYILNAQHSAPFVAAQVAAAESAGVPVAALTGTLTPPSATFQAWQVAQLQTLENALAAAYSSHSGGAKAA
ncbi:MAG TPA: zinc ABC transporter substrate-binding protein [Actinocrinis sp.]|jgi:zinc/manganese transport system substrate-binding protein